MFTHEGKINRLSENQYSVKYIYLKTVNNIMLQNIFTLFLHTFDKVLLMKLYYFQH